MRFPLPAAPPDVLRAAISDPAALRRWWDPAAARDGEVLSPGIDAPTMRLRGDTWTGDLVTARFAEGFVDVEAPGVGGHDLADLALAWEGALAALAWSLGRRGPVAWRRVELPVALAYDDAWTRIVGVLAAPPITVAGVRLDATLRVCEPPRLVVLDVGAGLLRLSFGPGDSVNRAVCDVLGDAGLPVGWEAWLGRRLGMMWESQV